MSLEDDIRVAHADPSALKKKDLARRKRVVKLLRTFPHELDRDERKRAQKIRASFTDAGDYVNLVGRGPRRKHSWVVGEIVTRDGSPLLAVRGSGPARELEITAEALEKAGPDTKGFWFGRAATDRAEYPVGPVDVLERVGAAR